MKGTEQAYIVCGVNVVMMLFFKWWGGENGEWRPEKDWGICEIVLKDWMEWKSKAKFVDRKDEDDANKLAYDE